MNIEDRASDQKSKWSVCGKPIHTHKPKPIWGTMPKVCLKLTNLVYLFHFKASLYKSLVYNFLLIIIDVTFKTVVFGFFFLSQAKSLADN